MADDTKPKEPSRRPIWINADVHKQMKVQAALKGCTLADFVIDLFERTKYFRDETDPRIAATQQLNAQRLLSAELEAALKGGKK